MTEAIMTQPRLSPDLANRSLKGAAALWLSVATAGHWIFVVYIVGYFGPLIFRGGLAALADTHLPNGFIPGEMIGNLAMAAHLFLAVVVIGGGPLQLIPWIRSTFPRFHRALGRTYLVSAVVSALAGLYMIWTRGTIGGLFNQVSISIDAVLIIVFAALTIRYAIAREIATHRRWAMRLFLVTSAVWFFRIGLMGWVMVTGGAGVDFEKFAGPFIYFWSFAQYLLPLAVLELYFRAQSSGNAVARLTMAGALVALTLATAIGIFAASMSMWLPRL